MTEFKRTILWAEHPEPGDTAKTYTFATEAELDAFDLALEEAEGWAGWREAEEGYVVPKEGWFLVVEDEEE